jgi:acetolactate synthase-1/3 small subunit
MLTPAYESPSFPRLDRRHAVLVVTVNDQPGVLLHVCGLFSRRAFQVEGLVRVPGGDGQSRIWLLVNENQRLDQLVKQLLKLEDVQNVECRSVESRVFAQLERWLQSSDGGVVSLP